NAAANPQGVSNVSFSVFDIDNGGGGSFVDKITVTALDKNGVAVNVTAVAASGSPSFSIAGRGTTSAVMTGTGAATDTTNTGSVNISFAATNIVSISVKYENAGAAVNQWVGISDVNFNSDARANSDTGAVVEDATRTVTAANGVIRGTTGGSVADTDPDNATNTLVVSGAVAGTGTVTQGAGVGAVLTGALGQLTLNSDGSY